MNIDSRQRAHQLRGLRAHGRDRSLTCPTARLVLDEVAAAGYAGIDLGPVGYLGAGPCSPSASPAADLGLAGAYLEFPFTDPAALETLYPELDAMLDTFDAVRGAVPGSAAAPDDRRRGQRRAPGCARTQLTPTRRSGLDEEGWATFRGRPERGRRALSRPRLRADVSPRDGHLRRGALGDRAGAGDLRRRPLPRDRAPLRRRRRPARRAARRAPERINHVHVKDARRAVMDAIIADGEPTPGHLVARGLLRAGRGRRRSRWRPRGARASELRGLVGRRAGHLPPDTRRASPRPLTIRRAIASSLRAVASDADGQSFASGSSGRGAWARPTCGRSPTHRDVAVVAVAEPVAALREQARSQLRPRGLTRPSTTFSTRGGMDGVLIVTPSDTHVEVIAQRRRGRDCRSSARSRAGSTPTTRRRAAADSSSDAGVPLQIAYWRRFVPELAGASRAYR